MSYPTSEIRPLVPAGEKRRDRLAQTFLYETGLFDNPAEIKSNSEHYLVKAAYRAADKIIEALGPATASQGKEP